jgi:hypothetical protein
MAAKEKTYSFRAPEGLAAQLDVIRGLWPVLIEDDRRAAELGRELQRQLLRRLTETGSSGLRGQSDVIRLAVEALVAATARLEEQTALAEEFAAWAQEDIEGDAFRAAALRAGATSWNDG